MSRTMISRKSSTMVLLWRDVCKMVTLCYSTVNQHCIEWVWWGIVSESFLTILSDWIFLCVHLTMLISMVTRWTCMSHSHINPSLKSSTLPMSPNRLLPPKITPRLWVSFRTVCSVSTCLPYVTHSWPENRSWTWSFGSTVQTKSSLLTSISNPANFPSLPFYALCLSGPANKSWAWLSLVKSPVKTTKTKPVIWFSKTLKMSIWSSKRVNSSQALCKNKPLVLVLVDSSILSG